MRLFNHTVPEGQHLIRYKFTNIRHCTYNKTKWGPGTTHAALDHSLSLPLCSHGWIHVYEHPLQACLWDSCHARYRDKGVLWRCQVWGDGLIEFGEKEGWKYCTTLEPIDAPIYDPNIDYILYLAKILHLYYNMPWPDERITDLQVLLRDSLQYAKLHAKVELTLGCLANIDTYCACILNEYFWKHQEQRGSVYDFYEKLYQCELT